MASTDTRAGFRLPWSTDRASSESSDGGSSEHPETAGGWPTEDGASPAAAVATAAPRAGSASDAPDAGDPLTGRIAPVPDPERATPTPKPPTNKKPSRFMADLTKAMQAAAEDARSRAISQLQADSKTHVESIRGRSATEAAGLRRTADDDVAGIREWSKAEIARIREETETRITDRKARLETEIEQHAGVIEGEVDAVQKMVAAFEADMASFFERLLGEEDPSRFATMAENLPEPPSFDDIPTALVAGAAEAAAEAADVAARNDFATSAEDGADPRFAALGLSPDYDAAEAEALADAGASDEDIPEIGDDALASRIAGLVPGSGPADEAAAATQVVVVGLVSVASIASFKRHLGRLAGVRSVGVSSGPEGEFVFAVRHGPDVNLHDAIPTLPGFQARVTSSTGAAIDVTAHDPESDAQAGAAD